jgi:hypothetical protein
MRKLLSFHVTSVDSLCWSARLPVRVRGGAGWWLTQR